MDGDRPPEIPAEAKRGTRSRSTGDLEPLTPERRVFVNRNLRFDQIQAVGFDMDYTIARYNKENIEALSFHLTAERLVEKLGYPDEVAQTAYDPDFVLRGLVIDKRLGNIFKMDAHGHVGRVFHGTHELSKDERRKAYRSVKVRLSAERYHLVDTLFALPEAALFANVIDLYEKEMGLRIAYPKLFHDIRTSIDECHRDGSLKAVIQADIPKFIERDPELPTTLHKLRSAGKKIFLLTNSYWPYTNAVMTYLLDGAMSEYPDWKRYFDVLIVGAQKPIFFTQDQPFLEVDPKSEQAIASTAEKFERGKVYQGGSIRRLERMLDMAGESILYVGDHIYGDIIRSKRDTLWRTALVLEELETELKKTREIRDLQSELYAVEERRHLADHEVQVLRLRLAEQEKGGTTGGPTKAQLDEKRQDLKILIDRERRLQQATEHAFNPYWGSIFHEGNELSRFGEQVEDYACIYTSRVTNLLRYSPFQYFRAPRHWLPHDKV